MWDFLVLGQLDESLEAVRDHFQKGGSWLGLLLIAGLIAGIIFVTFALTRRQQRGQRIAQEIDAEGVFFRMLAKLPLANEQRRMLTALAADLQLEHPTAMLLSPSLLARCAASWRERHAATPVNVRAMDEFLREARPLLFPGELPEP